MHFEAAMSSNSIKMGLRAGIFFTMDLKFPIIEHKFSRNFPTCLDHTVVRHQ